MSWPTGTRKQSTKPRASNHVLQDLVSNTLQLIRELRHMLIVYYQPDGGTTEERIGESGMLTGGTVAQDRPKMEPFFIRTMVKNYDRLELGKVEKMDVIVLAGDEL